MTTMTTALAGDRTQSPVWGLTLPGDVEAVEALVSR